jgi:hypothetical protein
MCRQASMRIWKVDGVEINAVADWKMPKLADFGLASTERYRSGKRRGTVRQSMRQVRTLGHSESREPTIGDGNLM